jgi:hypothetical protein
MVSLARSDRQSPSSSWITHLLVCKGKMHCLSLWLHIDNQRILLRLQSITLDQVWSMNIRQTPFYIRVNYLELALVSNILSLSPSLHKHSSGSIAPSYWYPQAMNCHLETSFGRTCQSYTRPSWHISQLHHNSTKLTIVSYSIKRCLLLAELSCTIAKVSHIT